MPADPDDGPRDQFGRRTLRRFHEGALAFNERRSPVLFIIEAASGALVIPAEPGMVHAAELVLYVPDESAWVMQLALAPSAIERPEAEEAVDRWAAYHGRSPSRVWIRCAIDGARSQSSVFDADALTVTNPLGPGEFGLIKRLNADRDLLARACRRHGPVEVADPLAVGVDPHGVDVRARFGIVRLEFPEGVEAKTVAQAGLHVDWLLGLEPVKTPGEAGGRAP